MSSAYAEGNSMVIDIDDEPPYNRTPCPMATTLSIDRKVPVLAGVVDEGALTLVQYWQLLMKDYSGLPSTGVRLADPQPIIDREGMWAESSQSPKNICPRKAKEGTLMSDVERAARNIFPLRAANTAETGAFLALQDSAYTCLSLTPCAPYL